MNMLASVESPHMNTAYDVAFAKNPRLTWAPWVGKHFDQSERRTLLLGESTYNWKPGDVNVARRIGQNDHLRILHQNHALALRRPSKYVRNVEKAIFRSGNPSLADRERLWSTVVYHNLVLRPMSSLAQRPTSEDYKMGWAVVIELADLLGLEQCIVYGLESRKIRALSEVVAETGRSMTQEKAATKIGKFRPHVNILTMGSHTLKFFFIRHPSSFFSWRNWGDFLKERDFLLA